MSEFVFLSEKGMRENNEDFYGNYKDEFFVIADGLSGYAVGEVAAKLAVERFLKSFKKVKGKEVGLEEIFKAANKEILQSSEKNPDWIGMGTTMVCASLQQNEVVVGNVGDSRGYVFSNGKLQQASKDDRSIMGFITAALGLDNTVRPHISKEKVEKGDLLLLCTDGLTDFGKASVLAEIFSLEEVALSTKVISKNIRRIKKRLIP